VHVSVCTDTGEASLGGRVWNDGVKSQNFIRCVPQVSNYWSKSLNKPSWFLKSWLHLWTAIQIMCHGRHKPSYATGLVEFQLTIICCYGLKEGSTLYWTLGHPPVNQLTPTSTNLHIQTSTAITGGKYNLLLCMNFIQHLGNILYYTFGGYIWRLRVGAGKSFPQPTSCHNTESKVSLERVVCSCTKFQVFSCYRGWKEACQATRAISTTLRW